MGFRDDSEATRARADALERENRDLRRQVEDLQSAPAPDAVESRPRLGRMSGLWIPGALLLLLGGAMAVTHRVPPVAVPVFIVPGLVLIMVGVVSSLIHVVGPDEALVISGRSHRLPDGRRVGYRLAMGGRVVRVPILEQVERISLRTLSVPVELKEAYTKGGERVSLQASALVKISSDPVLLPNAVERFLGRSPEEVARVAGETITGHARSVLATLTVEELEQDHLATVQAFVSEAQDDMDKLGLTLDALQIKQVRRG